MSPVKTTADDGGVDPVARAPPNRDASAAAPIVAAPATPVAESATSTPSASTNGAAAEAPTSSSNGPAIDARLASERFLRAIPRDFARSHAILSQGALPGGERLVVSSKTSPAAIFNVGVRLGVAVEWSVADSASTEPIVRAIDEAFSSPLARAHAARASSPATNGSLAADFEIPTPDALPPLEELIREADRDLLRTQGKNPVVRLVDALLFDAVGRNASDVHLQPADHALLVRYRLDGALATVRELPKSLAASVLGRVKVMGRMDVAEHRLPQDGRATVTIGERVIDLRIGVFPTSYGERAVLRILDSSRRLSGLDELGMPETVRARFLRAASCDHGLILVTGPTGSGKTTTLYSTLSLIASPDLNVMTLEDPIEYDLARARTRTGTGATPAAAAVAEAGAAAPEAGVALSVSQSQVNLKKGVNFATGLRHLLRQDPDVVLVGEIRDAETAGMAIQSSQTGHLVFSTLHTNDAPSAVTRLFDLGVEPYLVSASLKAVLAQRLVRVLHRACAGSGCQACLSTGFLGRIGIYELMVVDEDLQRAISARADLAEIRRLATAQGMRSLREEGARLVAESVTTRAEVERVIQGFFS